MVRWLVEQQQVGLGGEDPGQRGASQLTAGEGRELALGLLGAEAEAAQHREDVVAPAITAAGFEPALRGGVGSHRLLRSAARHLPLEPRQLGLGLQHVGAAGEDVVAELGARFARRALIVEGDAGAALHGQRPRLRGQLTGEHPEQGRLAGAVAAGQRHPVARLELERDVPEEELAADVDVERGCGRDCHRDPR